MMAERATITIKRRGVVDSTANNERPQRHNLQILRKLQDTLTTAQSKLQDRLTTSHLKLQDTLNSAVHLKWQTKRDISDDDEHEASPEKILVPKKLRRTVSQEKLQSRLHRSSNVVVNALKDVKTSTVKYHFGMWIAILIFVPLPVVVAGSIAYLLLCACRRMMVRTEHQRKKADLPKGISYVGYVYLLFLTRRKKIKN
jgi:hypothetical protein